MNNIKEIRTFLFILSLFMVSSVSTKNVTFGFSRSYLETVPAPLTVVFALSKHLEHGMRIFMDWAEENGPFMIGGEEVYFNLHREIDNYKGEVISANYEKMINDDNISIFLSGLGTDPGIYGSNVTETYKKIFISTSTTSEAFSENKQMAFSVYPTQKSMNVPFIPLFKLAGVKSVTFMKSPDSVRAPTLAACIGYEDEFRKQKIEDFKYVYYTADLNNTSNYSRAVDQIIEYDSDLLISCEADSPYLKQFLLLFKERDYTPRGGHALTLDFRLEVELVKYWTVGITVADYNLKFPNGTFILSEEDFLQRHKKLFTTVQDDEDRGNVSYRIGYFGAISCEVILAAMKAANTTDNLEMIADHIRRGTHESFIGSFSYDARNTVLYPGVSGQNFEEKKLRILGPYYIAEAEYIYPMPTWKERVYKDKYSPIEIAVMVILAVMIVNSIFWLVLTVVHRNRKEIVASSPTFLYSMLVGSIFIYISIYFWTPHKKTIAGCSIHVAFLLFGFLLLFGSMLVKAWRVHVLFSQKTLEVFKISNTQVSLFLAILFAVDLVLYIVWVALTQPILIAMESNDPFRMNNWYFVCSTKTGGTILVWIMVGYHGLLFLYGAYLALRIRTVPYKIYDESKIIAFCIYNVGLVAIIVAILEGTSASKDPLVQFALRSFLILLSTCVTVNAMFIGKFTANRRMQLSTSNSSSSTNSSKMSSMNDSQMGSVTVQDYERDIEKYKKQIKKLKTEAKELREALDAFKSKE